MSDPNAIEIVIEMLREMDQRIACLFLMCFIMVFAIVVCRCKCKGVAPPRKEMIKK